MGGEGAGEGAAFHAEDVGVDESSAVELGKDAEDASGAVAVFDAVLLCVGCELAEAGHSAREGVDILHGEVHFSLLGDGEQVEYGVGAASHGDVECHGVEEGLARGDAAWQHALVVVLVVGECVPDDLSCCLLHEPYAVLVCGEYGAVAGQSQSYGFGEGVHGVCGEHTGAASASGACALLDFCQFIVGDGGVGALDHGGDEVEVFALVLSGFHGSSGDEDGGDIQPHGSHEHSGGDLVAVGDADHGVGLVGVDHIFYAVGNDVT